MKTPMLKRLCGQLSALAIGACALLLQPAEAQAEEIRLTGPLAGAPAVRHLRLYRKGRVELSPNVSASLLDEYRRQAVFGLRLNYGLTDWLSIGAWGGVTTSMLGANWDTDLTHKIEGAMDARQCAGVLAGGQTNTKEYVDCKLISTNIDTAQGAKFSNQLATIDWMAAGQVTLVPFRGKLGLFNSVFVDSELYLFGGPAFVGVRERADCRTGACSEATSFVRQSRLAIAPTFGLGFTFFMSKWTAIGAEYRATPFALNPGGFDVAGGGPNQKFPDGAVNESDRQLKFNHMVSLSVNFYLPMDYQVTE